MSNSQNIIVPGIGRVWLAPLGTIAPVDSVTAMPSGWKDVGYSDDGGVTIVTTPTFGAVNSLQSLLPTRRFQTGDATTIAADLQEFSSPNLKASFGGGRTELVSAAVVGPPAKPAQYRFRPPQPGTRKTVACIIEWMDGGYHFRAVFPSVFPDAGVTIKVSRKAEVSLPLRLSVLGSDGVDPFYLLLDVPADPADVDA